MRLFHLLLAGLLGLLGLPGAHAQETELLSISYGTSWVPDHGRPHRVQAPTLEARLPLRQRAATQLGASFGYHALLGGRLAGLGNLHGVGGQLALSRRLSEHSVLSVAAGGGVYSDWQDVSGEDWRWTAAAQLRHRYTPALLLGVGLTYNRQFFGHQLMPYLLVQWAITPRLQLQGQPPFRQQLRYTLTPRLALGLAARGSNGSYRLSARADSSRYLRAAQWQVGGLAEYRLAPHWVLVAEAGRLVVQQYRTFAADARVPWTFGPALRQDHPALTELGQGSWWAQVGLSFRLARPSSEGR